MNHVDHVTLKRYPVLNSKDHLKLKSLNLSRQNVLSMSISLSSVYTLITSRFGKNEKVVHSTPVSPTVLTPSFRNRLFQNHDFLAHPKETMTHSCFFTPICIRLACNDRLMPVFAFSCSLRRGSQGDPTV